MTHSEMDELYELYVLGALEPELSTAIDEHLGQQCEHCLERLNEAVTVSSAMSSMAELHKPPSHLRTRVLSTVRPPKRSAGWIFGVAGLSAACVALAVYALNSSASLNSLHGEVAALRQQLTSVSLERNELRTAVQILSRPTTRTVQFGVAENVPHGKVLLNKSGGLVFVGSQLPALASDRTFELWLIPAKGAAQKTPIPAGLFRSDTAGNVVSVSGTPIDPAAVQAVAVSIEPLQGSPAPTTTPILIVSLS